MKGVNHDKIETIPCHIIVILSIMFFKSIQMNAQEDMYMGREIKTIETDNLTLHYVDGLYVMNFHEWSTEEQIEEFLKSYNLNRYRPVSPTGRWHVMGETGRNAFSEVASFRSNRIVKKAVVAYIPEPRK